MQDEAEARIQKVLATAGVASRREIERMIGEGRISVNGKPATIGQKLGAADVVRVDGRLLALANGPEPTRVLIYKKRVGEVTTREDPEGRRTVFRKLPKLERGRWIVVGRLDINTSGLLLFTNNGELARRLMHPSFEVAREYAVRVLGTVDDAVIGRLTRGVRLDDGEARFDAMRPIAGEDGEGANQWFEVRLAEGRNREVRRLFESQGLQVSRLIRIAYGPVQLGRGIRSGTAREATAAELADLMAAVGLEEPAAPATPSRHQRRAAEARQGKPARSPRKATDEGRSPAGDARQSRSRGGPRSSRHGVGDEGRPAQTRSGPRSGPRPDSRAGRKPTTRNR